MPKVEEVKYTQSEVDEMMLEKDIEKEEAVLEHCELHGKC
jgi:hypothetical protein